MKKNHVRIPFLAVLALGASLTAASCAKPPPPAPPPPPAAPPPETKLVLVGVTMTGAQINMIGEIEFDTAAATIRDTPGSQKALNGVHKVLIDNPIVTKLRVEGHTDSDGSEANNQALSEKRALAVVKWLVDKGIDAKRLHGVGCAARDPLMPNTTAENKQKNRRTELDIEEIQDKPADALTAACAANPARPKP
jgi:OOP family OmpA-OmpF porin